MPDIPQSDTGKAFQAGREAHAAGLTLRQVPDFTDDGHFRAWVEGWLASNPGDPSGCTPCTDCGADYYDPERGAFMMSDQLWQSVVGDDPSVVLCPPCFVKRTDAVRIEPQGGVERGALDRIRAWASHYKDEARSQQRGTIKLIFDEANAALSTPSNRSERERVTVAELAVGDTIVIQAIPLQTERIIGIEDDRRAFAGDEEHRNLILQGGGERWLHRDNPALRVVAPSNPGDPTPSEAEVEAAAEADFELDRLADLRRTTWAQAGENVQERYRYRLRFAITAAKSLQPQPREKR